MNGRIIRGEQYEPQFLDQTGHLTQWKHYPVVITDRITDVGWGANWNADAHDDLNDLVHYYRCLGQIVYDAFIVIARRRSEVVERYRRQIPN